MDDSTTDDSDPSELRSLLSDVITGLAIVLIIGGLLFFFTGIWPPMVSVESGSMEPHMERGDLIVVMETERYSPAYSSDIGVVTAQTGTQEEYSKFGSAGDVIVYTPNGSETRTPVIHRAMFQVNESEDWTEKANSRYLPSDSCTQVPNCPAPTDGFITKGDANPYYDQAVEISDPVKNEWITAKAEFKIPYLGYVRLIFS